MVSFDLPGRGERMRETLLTDMHEMAEDIFRQIKPLISSPYAIYGHSMGSMLGYLLTHKIKQTGLLLPRHLFFSGGRAPSYPPFKKKAHLPQKEFWEAIRDYGGLQEEIFDYPELLAFFEPILRHDLQAVEGFHVQETKPLNGYRFSHAF